MDKQPNAKGTPKPMLLGQEAQIQARLKAKMTPKEVAKQARMSVADYKSIERKGDINYDVAMNLSRILGCRVDVYL